MNKQTRQGIHDLLDRVLNANTEEAWPRFWLTRKTDGTMNLVVRIGAVKIEQEFGVADQAEAIARAKEATDE